MKTITQYIKDNTEYKIYAYPNTSGYRTFEEFMHLNNITEDTLTQDDIDAYVECAFDDLIFYPKMYVNRMDETLVSHLPSHLISKLKHAFGDKIDDFRPSDDKSGKFSFRIKKEDYESVVKSDKFISLLKFYNYNEPRYNDYPISKQRRVIIEPNVTENVSKYVLEKCDGILYHVTNVKNKDRIMKTGLRPKLSKDFNIASPDFTDYHKRVYCVAVDDDKKLKDALYAAYDMAKRNDDTPQKYCVIKIDLKPNIHTEVYIDNMQFYKDVRSKNEYAVYTFNFLPKECLEVYIEEYEPNSK